MRRPCAHQPEDSPETISSGSDGLSEGEERTARIGDPSVHKGSGRGRPVRRRVM